MDILQNENVQWTAAERAEQSERGKHKHTFEKWHGQRKHFDQKPQKYGSILQWIGRGTVVAVCDLSWHESAMVMMQRLETLRWCHWWGGREHKKSCKNSRRVLKLEKQCEELWEAFIPNVVFVLPPSFRQHVSRNTGNTILESSL